ncbi:MAG: hypothetical protein HKM05_11340 [Spirochaetales bacterium]|nr:hypothetical protein [Spirochaetales bacterium]
MSAVISALAEGQSEQEQQILTGVLSVRGNEPFTYLSLTAGTKVWRLTGPLVPQLLPFQNHVVKVWVKAEESQGAPQPESRFEPPSVQVLRWKLLSPSGNSS